MKYLKPECPFCSQKDAVRKHGIGNTGLQRYLCTRCHRTFQTRYYYKANYQNTNDQISGLAKAGKSPQEIGAQLKISVATVNRRVKALNLLPAEIALIEE